MSSIARAARLVALDFFHYHRKMENTDSPRTAAPVVAPVSDEGGVTSSVPASLSTKRPLRSIPCDSAIEGDELMQYRLNELQSLARRCNIVYTGSNKSALVRKLEDHLKKPYKYKNTVVVTSSIRER